MAQSILQTRKECYICRRWFNVVTERGLEEHHIMTGPLRPFSEQHGLKVWLCHRHHNEPGFSVHHNAALANELKAVAQQRFEETYHGSASAHEVWLLHTGKDYLNA